MLEDLEDPGLDAGMLHRPSALLCNAIETGSQGEVSGTLPSDRRPRPIQPPVPAKHLHLHRSDTHGPGTITGFWGYDEPAGHHQVGSPLLQRQPLRRCSHSQPPEGQTMKRFVAVFQVRLPNGDEGREFTTIFADDLKQALDKWATTSKTGEFLISIQASAQRPGVLRLHPCPEHPRRLMETPDTILEQHPGQGTTTPHHTCQRSALLRLTSGSRNNGA